MSSQSGSQKLRRNGSPAGKIPGPLRATLPVSSMVHADISAGKSVSGSSAKGRILTTPSNNRSRQSPWRVRQWSPTPKVEKSPETADTVTHNYSPVIRRTASLDAIYAQGLWPRGNYQQLGSNLRVDKSTQTPEEWTQDERRFSCKGIEASPSRDQKKQRLCLPVHQYSVSPGKVAASTNTERFSVSQAIPVPVPGPQLISRVRNSVEGFNTEIEKLISRSQEIVKPQEPTPDGHRAPVAELLRSSWSHQRSVNTQTPVANSTRSSSGNSSPLGSVSPLVWGSCDNWSSRPNSSSGLADASMVTSSMIEGSVRDQIHSVSPEVFQDFQGLSLSGADSVSDRWLGSSPRVSRFLCREPPDGCEKVTLKAVEQSRKLVDDLSLGYCPPKPNALFVLQPSSSSAFSPIPSHKMASASALPPLRPSVPPPLIVQSPSNPHLDPTHQE